MAEADAVGVHQDAELLAAGESGVAGDDAVEPGHRNPSHGGADDAPLGVAHGGGGADDDPPVRGVVARLVEAGVARQGVPHPGGRDVGPPQEAVVGGEPYDAAAVGQVEGVEPLGVAGLAQGEADLGRQRGVGRAGQEAGRPRRQGHQADVGAHAVQVLVEGLGGVAGLLEALGARRGDRLGASGGGVDQRHHGQRQDGEGAEEQG